MWIGEITMTYESLLFSVLFGLSALAAVSFGQSGVEQAFLRAIVSGETRSVAEMLSGDPKLASTRNEKGQSAVILAIYYGKKDIVPLLINARPSLDIFEASAAGQTGRVKELIRRNRTFLNAISQDGFHPLGLAIFFGHPETAIALLDAGAEVNLASQESMRVTPLHSAVAADQLDLARELVRRGANVNATAERGLTPLHEASARGDLEMVKLLVAAKANVYAKASDGKTPTDLASEHGHTETLAFLRKVASNRQKQNEGTRRMLTTNGLVGEVIFKTVISAGVCCLTQYEIFGTISPAIILGAVLITVVGVIRRDALSSAGRSWRVSRDREF